MTHLVSNQFRSQSKRACCCLRLYEDAARAVEGDQSSDGNAFKSLRLLFLIMSVGPLIALYHFNKRIGCREHTAQGRVVVVGDDVLFAMPVALKKNYADSFQHNNQCQHTKHGQKSMKILHRTQICKDRPKQKKVIQCQRKTIQSGCTKMQVHIC